ncbi:MAG TPA: glycosyltransferase, partial [Streptosporangiaceae bacterium]|nr:glycosyltransferase [Streptosporangiaceae bacterium]
RLRRRLEGERRRAIERLRAMLRDATETRRSVLLITEHVYPNHPIIRRNVEQLLAQGAMVDLVCMVSSNVPDWEANHPGLRLHRIRLDHRRSPALRYIFEYAFFFLAALPVVLRLSMRRRYSVVQVDNLPDFLVFLALPMRLRGARVVMFCHELTPELLASRLRARANHPLIAIAAWLEHQATAFADHVTVPSAACARILAGRGVDPRKVSIVPNLVPINRPDGVARPASAPVLITHGSLIERYGVQVAIRALAELTPAWPELTLRVLGDGEYRPNLEWLARDLGLTGRVIFRGFVPWREAMAEVSTATIGLVPVINDGYGELLLPGKLFDYAATGTPAVCAGLPTIAEYFPPDSIAFFAPGDHHALAEQIDRLLRDPVAAAAQAVRARDIARPEKVFQSYLAALGLTTAAAAA